MKLNDLIDAFASEITATMPYMDEKLSELAEISPEEPRFLDALSEYNGYAERMGEAAEMAGFSGLQLVCNHIVENTLLLMAAAADERDAVLSFLTACPALMVHYLQNITDPSSAAGLVDLLRSAPSPMSVEQALKVTYQLGAIPQQMSQGPADSDDMPARPVLATRADIDVTMPDDVNKGLLDSFFQEAPEQATQLINLANNMIAGEGDISDLVAAKRIVHTLKGSSAIIGIRAITSISHHLEDILEFYETGSGVVPLPVSNLLLDTAYCLEQIIDFLIGNDEFPEQTLDVLQAILDTANRIDRGEEITGSVYRSQQDVQSAVAAVTTEDNKPAASTAASGQKIGSALRVDIERIDELFRLSGDVMVQGTAIETRIKSLATVSRSLMQQNIRVQKRLFELEALMDVRTHTMANASMKKSESFDLLEMDEYSEMHSTKNALMEEVSDTRTYVTEIDSNIADLNGLQLQQQNSIKDLQYLVLSTRTAPVNTLASRLKRNIRNTCQATGKQAQLSLEGGDTLVDSDVLSQLSEPLLHLMRNAIDHGIEPPEARIQAGKAESGLISLSFSRKGQLIELVFEDDGKGLDHGAIFKRAVEHGMIQPDAVLTEDEVFQLILASGFSTRDEVSEVSGRGVGMDVVRQWVQDMNGTMRISSNPGQGTRIVMRFAASLSTVQSLIVSVNEQSYAVPYVHVEQVLSRGVGKTMQIEKKWVFKHLDYNLPFMPLSYLLGEPVTNSDFDSYDVMIVSANDKLYALGVDELVDARDVLVKTPKRYTNNLQGITGLSILGDGSVAINLDLSSLMQSKRKSVRKRKQPLAEKSTKLVVSDDVPSILIVDDALSIRNALKQLVEDIGYTPITARDGMDAIEQLTINKPKLVLTDLEMPNLNGVELTSYIRNQPALKDLPVIMITSRSQAKHRDLATEAGVDEYITKPYIDADIITLIGNYMRRTVV